MVYIVCDGDTILCAFVTFLDACDQVSVLSEDLDRPACEFTIQTIPFCK